MLTYNNDHLITGYIKQLLNAYKLPTYKVYTLKDEIAYNNKDFATVKVKVDTNGELITNNSATTVPELTVQVEKYIIPTTSHQLMPYIKDNSIQIYSWDVDKQEYTWKILHLNSESFLTKMYNHSKHYQIKNTIYDSATHNYLGEFLRYNRDKNNLDLMPLYNCFSNEMPQNLKCEFNVAVKKDGATKDTPISTTLKAKFISKDTQYKIYMLPVKYLTEYTIALASTQPVEFFCGFYDNKFINCDHDKTTTTSVECVIEKFWAATYEKVNNIAFNKPIIYSKLLSDEVRDLLFNNTDKDTNFAVLDESLKLFIKIPVSTETSYVILEGNYISYNDRQYKLNNTIWNDKLKAWETKSIWMQNSNHAIINFEYIEEALANNDIIFKPITFLQLLTLNTKNSYPFADRLIEYLLGNTITNLETLEDNIKRIQTVMEDNRIYIAPGYKGLWDEIIRPTLYSYINKYNTSSQVNHDILGYVDKDIEKVYESKNYTTDTVINTLMNVDIYEDLYAAAKVKTREQ